MIDDFAQDLVLLVLHGSEDGIRYRFQKGPLLASVSLDPLQRSCLVLIALAEHAQNRTRHEGRL